MSKFEPKNGDFASMLEAMSGGGQKPSEKVADLSQADTSHAQSPPVPDDGEEAPEQAPIDETEEMILERYARAKALQSELTELQALPEISEEELTRQAMGQLGTDDDAKTQD